MKKLMIHLLCLVISLIYSACSSSHSERLDYWEIANNNGSSNSDNPSGNTGDCDTPGNQPGQEGNAAGDHDGQIPNSNDSDITPYCGDGIVTGDELCEPGNTKACTDLDPVLYKGGNASCQSDCLSYNIATCEKYNWDVLSMGRMHSCGIRGGSLYCWGNNAWNQLGTDKIMDESAPVLIGNAHDWTAVAAGNTSTCAIRQGAIYCWGGDSKNSPHIMFPEAGTAWEKLALGMTHGCALRQGALFCWGNNYFGQVGVGTTSSEEPLTQIGTDTGWSDISLVYSQSCGINNGRLYCWGSSMSGSLGSNCPFGCPNPTAIDTDTGWQSVSSGMDHTCGIKNHKLYCWGNNQYGQLGTGNTNSTSDPMQVEDTAAWQSVAAGDEHTCGIKNNTLLCWGRNNAGQKGNGTTGDSVIPTRVGTSANWQKVFASHDTSCGMAGDELYCWGSNISGKLGIGVNPDTFVPEKISDTYGWKSPITGKTHACTLKNGQIYCWGSMHCNYENRITFFDETGGWDLLAGGEHHLCGLRLGNVYCWGRNDYGELGTGTAGDGSDQKLPQLVNNDSIWNTVSLGQSHTCAITEGKLYCWGNNRTGQLGIGTEGEHESKTTPARVGTESNWQSVTAGDDFTCGIRDGFLYCWGNHASGQLGIGDKTVVKSKNVPSHVGIMGGWSSVSAGFHQACAINNGKLFCWGDHRIGIPQQDDETEQRYNKDYPAQVGSADDWQSVRVGDKFVCGIRKGALYCWGNNYYGQLGNGLFREKKEIIEPLRIGSDTDWAELAPGTYSTCATKTNGSLYCWGSNNYGQLGDGTAWFEKPVKVK